MQRIILTLLSLLLSSLMLTACGLKGPLYMPKDNAALSSQVADTAVTDREIRTVMIRGKMVKAG